MKTIPETFKAKGYIFRLVKRTLTHALYQGENIHGGSTYEIHKVRILKPRVTKYRNPEGGFITVTLPEREVLASTELFGKHAWSFGDRTKAERYFDEISHHM